MPQTAIDFRSSKRLSLMGVVTMPEGGGEPFPAIVVCHPHPMLGGDMDHPVVTAICRAASRDGIASLRFRGVGDSQGVFGEGGEEQDDLVAAFKLMKAFPGIDGHRLALVGYSFGASMVLNTLGRCKSARALAVIAPPVSSTRSTGVRKSKLAKLFVAGRNDRVVPSVQLQRALDEVRPPVQFVELADADHALIGREQAAADEVSEFLARALSD